MKVLVSHGYGAGWSTWGDPGMATDKRLIELFEHGCTEEEMADLCVECGYTNGYDEPPYMGGFYKLAVEEVPNGSYFKIREYDGAEYIEIFNKDEWFYAID